MYNETINIRKAITKHRNNEWERKLKKLNPKDNSIWTMTKALKTEYKSIPTLIKNNIEAITDEEKVEMLADQFEKVHSINLVNNTIEQNGIIEEVQTFLQNEIEEDAHKYSITPKKVFKIIMGLPAKKASGADGI